jgi:hypothetical protein
MARRKNGADAEHTEKPPADEVPSDGTNCTDETRRQFYREALIAKIGVESAAATVKAKTGEYRNVLKAAKKAGVDPNAITRTLALRFQEEEELILQMREELKMLDLAGVIPNIKDKLLARLDVQEPTANEQAQISLDRAYDDGAFEGRSGAMRDTNPFNPGTDLYVAWDQAWIAGQAAIAKEMMPEPPAAVQ